MARRQGSRVASVLVGLCLAASVIVAVPRAEALTYPDVPDVSLFVDDIDWLSDFEITTGYDDGSFRPTLPVTRQAVAAYLHRLWLELGQPDPDPLPDPGFSDVGDTHPFFSDIAWLAESGITTGFADGTFRPAAPVTRQAMAAYLHRFGVALGEPDPQPPTDPGFSDVGPTHPFFGDIAWLSASGITTGFPDGSFRPAVAVTRQAMAAYLHRSWEAVVEPLVVDSGVDAVDALPGDGVCATASGACSLRAAITETNAVTGPAAIELAVDVTLSLAGVAEEQNLTGDLDVRSTVTIDGAGHTVDGAQLDRVFDHHEGRLRLRDVTVTGGRGPIGLGFMLAQFPDPIDHGYGGAVRAVAPLVVVGSHLTANRAQGRNYDGSYSFLQNEGGRGGGLYANGTDVLVLDSVVDGNLADKAGTGGGIASDDASVQIRSSRIADNRARQGGGIWARATTIAVRESLVERNATVLSIQGDGDSYETFPTFGAGLYVFDGTAEVSSSTFVGNDVNGGSGGAVAVLGTAGGAAIVNSTFSGNIAERANNYFEGYHYGGTGAAVHATRPVAISLTTIVDNYGDSALSGGSITLGGSVLTAEAPMDERLCAAPLTSAGHNVVAGSSCALGGVGDQVSTSAQVDLLEAAAGASLAHPLLVGSPALDAIPAGTPGLCDGTVPTDQAGVDRPSGSGCDAGAREGDGVPASPSVTITVDAGGNEPDAVPGDGSCDIGNGTCTLRAALGEANVRNSDDTIVLATDVTLVTSVGSNLFGGGDLDITDDVTIDGAGHRVSGDATRVLDHHGGWLRVRDVTVAEGSLSGQSGAGIRTIGRLTVEDSTFDSNTADGDQICCSFYSAWGDGGAVHAHDAVVDLDRATFVDNGVWYYGSGAALHADGSVVRIHNSTFSGNASSGLSLDPRPPIGSVSSSVEMVGVTMVEAGALRLSADFEIAGSVIVTDEAVCSGPTFPISGGYNLTSDASCSLAGVGDQQGVDPLLGALADNGGSTATHLPSGLSPLVDAIPAGTTGLCDGTLATDQRSFARPAGVGCDIGAVERMVSDP